MFLVVLLYPRRVSLWLWTLTFIFFYISSASGALEDCILRHQVDLLHSCFSLALKKASKILLVCDGLDLDPNLRGFCLSFSMNRHGSELRSSSNPRSNSGRSMLKVPSNP